MITVYYSENLLSKHRQTSLEDFDKLVRSELLFSGDTTFTVLKCHFELEQDALQFILKFQ